MSPRVCILVGSLLLLGCSGGKQVPANGALVDASAGSRGAPDLGVEAPNASATHGGDGRPSSAAGGCSESNADCVMAPRATTRDGGTGAMNLDSKGCVPAPIDCDEDYPNRTERLYLSGRGTDDAVDWEFLINTGRNSGSWSTIPVPSNWEFHGFGTFQYGFNASTEVGTYRRSFRVPEAWAGLDKRVVFEGSMTDTEVFVNGTSAGPVHQGGFYRFRHDVTSLLRDGDNEIEVVVAKQSANASVNSAERDADYWTFGGIFRPVYLEARPPQSIDRLAIDAASSGALRVDVHVSGLTEDAELVARVFDDQLTPVGQPLSVRLASGATVGTLSGQLDGIEPWSAESPRRYRLAVELMTSGGVRHAFRENFGFRTVEVRPGEGIFVNGTRVTLRGANRHSFWPESGRALNPRLTLADVQLMKDMNMNAVRSSHYPADRYFLDQADSAGLFVLDELAGWQSAYDETTGRRLVEEMVTFDANHPSILFWDNGNEGGWNAAVDGEFARWDVQRRPVLHPWATFGGINTDHYESYSSTLAILAGPTLFMPTEFLHGLYDGGGGAGLDDYWRAMLGSPRGAGGFLWALVDEGVRLPDGRIDTAGNSAPDGILGPYREKEGSFYAVRQIWSPVQIEAQVLPPDFSGTLDVENHYDQTDLDTVRFRWRLVRFDLGSTDAGHRVLLEGGATTGSIAPGATGTLSLGLPEDRRNAHALLLDAYDASQRLVSRWSWMLRSPSELRAELVDPISEAPAVATDAAETVRVAAAGRVYAFSKTSAVLTSVSVEGQPLSFGNGPSLSVGTSTLESFDARQEGTDYVVSASFSGDLRTVTWRVLGNGWLSLSYEYHLVGSYGFFGVDFDYPEAELESVQWLGRGPSRVWKNRMRGPWHDLWERDKNEAITGQRWDYPEFKGYFADTCFARFRTTEGSFEVVTDSSNLFLRLYTPENGVNPQAAAMSFPQQDISFLHGIPAIGDKFLPPSELGPQSREHALDDTFGATLYFRFAR